MSVAFRSRARAAALALMAGALLTVGAPAQAQRNEEAFKDGLKARSEKQWAQVVAHMRRALLTDNNESTQKLGGRLGFGGTEYLPHFFLGEAYFSQGNCAAAIQAWSESERQGVIRTRADFYTDIRNGFRACEERGFLLPARYDSRMAGARQQLTAVNARATRARNLGDPAIWNSSPTIAEQYNRAIDEYRTGEALLKDAQATRLEGKFKEVDAAVGRANAVLTALEAELKTAIDRNDRIRRETGEVGSLIADGHRLNAQIDASKVPLTPSQQASRADGLKKLATARDQLVARTEVGVGTARTAAREGHDLLEQVLTALNAFVDGELKQKLELADRNASEVFRRVDTEFATVESLREKNPTRVTPDILGQLADLQKRLQSAKRRLGVAVKSRQPATIEAQTTQAQEMLVQLTAIGAAISPRALTLEDRGVPLWLQIGAGHFLAGDYAGALDALDDGAPEGPAALQVHVLRAAAQHALYVRSGQKDTARRDDALASIARGKAIDPSFQPDKDVFSPRFIEFYQRGAAPAPR